MPRSNVSADTLIDKARTVPESQCTAIISPRPNGPKRKSMVVQRNYVWPGSLSALSSVIVLAQDHRGRGCTGNGTSHLHMASRS